MSENLILILSVLFPKTIKHGNTEQSIQTNAF